MDRQLELYCRGEVRGERGLCWCIEPNSDLGATCRSAPETGLGGRGRGDETGGWGCTLHRMSTLSAYDLGDRGCDREGCCSVSRGRSWILITLKSGDFHNWFVGDRDSHSSNSMVDFLEMLTYEVKTNVFFRAMSNEFMLTENYGCMMRKLVKWSQIITTYQSEISMCADFPSICLKSKIGTIRRLA